MIISITTNLDNDYFHGQLYSLQISSFISNNYR